MKEYQNEFSIQEELTDDDFRIEWQSNSEKIEIYIKEKLYLIMDLENKVGYSQSTSSEGPYGQPIGLYKNE